MLLFTAGCGDGDHDTLTKEEWITRAEAVCADMIAQEEEIAEPESPEDMAAGADQIAEITRTGIDELETLPAPEGDEDAVAEILAAFDDLADAGVDFLDAVVESGSLEDMSGEVEAAFRDLEAMQRQATEIAEAYGLTGCFPSDEGNG